MICSDDNSKKWPVYYLMFAVAILLFPFTFPCVVFEHASNCLKIAVWLNWNLPSTMHVVWCWYFGFFFAQIYYSLHKILLLEIWLISTNFLPAHCLFMYLLMFVCLFINLFWQITGTHYITPILTLLTECALLKMPI